MRFDENSIKIRDYLSKLRTQKSRRDANKRLSILLRV